MAHFKIAFRISADGKRVVKEVEEGVKDVQLKMHPGSAESGWLFVVEGETVPVRQIILPH